MKKLIVCIFMLFPAVAYGDAPKVLFIGNSLSSDLPALIAELAKSRGHAFQYDVYVPGGKTLAQHAADPMTFTKIKEQSWDFIVLQEQSQWPAFSQDQVRRGVYPYAEELSRKIRYMSPKARIVFYMTMAAENGDRANIHVSNELGTYEGMQKRVNETYVTMAHRNDALLAPVGLVWEKVRAKDPSLKLYTDDEKHPNNTGAYLAACVFYQTLFNETAVGLVHPKEITAETAAILQKTTDAIMKLPEWNWEVQNRKIIPAPEKQYDVKADSGIMEIVLFLNANQMPKGAASYKIDDKKKSVQYFDAQGQLMQENSLNQKNEIVSQDYNSSGKVDQEIKITPDLLNNMFKEGDKYHHGKVVPVVTQTLQILANAAENYAQTNGRYPQKMQDLTGAALPYLGVCMCDQTINMYQIQCRVGPEGYEFAANAHWSHEESYVITTGGKIAVKEPGAFKRGDSYKKSVSPCVE